MKRKQPDLQEIAQSIAHGRTERLEEERALTPRREAEQRAIRSLLRAANYVSSKGDDRKLYDHDSSGLHHLERMGQDQDAYYVEMGSSVEEVNRELCAMWVEEFWLEAARDVAACIGADELEDLVPRTPEQGLGLALFAPLVAAGKNPGKDLKRQTVAQLAGLRLTLRPTLGQGDSGLEDFLGLLAAELYRRDPAYHDDALSDPFPEAVVGRGHLDCELDEWDVLDAHQRICHASDFSWVIAAGKHFELPTGNQRAAVGVLWENWEDAGRLDGAALTEAEIGERIGSSSDAFRMDVTFRKCPALGTIIRRAGRGQFALHLSELREISSKPQ